VAAHVKKTEEGSFAFLLLALPPSHRQVYPHTGIDTYFLGIVIYTEDKLSYLSW
jgi:hypothetical protein